MNTVEETQVPKYEVSCFPFLLTLQSSSEVDLSLSLAKARFCVYLLSLSLSP